MKHLFTVLICFSLFCCFTGCSLGKQNKVVDENFFCKVIDENNVAIGKVRTCLFPQENWKIYSVKTWLFNWNGFWR